MNTDEMLQRIPESRSPVLSARMTGIRETGKRNHLRQNFDNDEETPGPVVVRRAAYDAGMKLEAEVKAGVHGPAFENARDKALKYRAAGGCSGRRIPRRAFQVPEGARELGAGTDIVVGNVWKSRH